VRGFWEVAMRGFRRYATYRGVTVAGAFTNCFFGLLPWPAFVAPPCQGAGQTVRRRRPGSNTGCKSRARRDHMRRAALPHRNCAKRV
jgi:hypothetical protein